MKIFKVRDEAGTEFEVDESKISEAERDGFLPVVTNGRDTFRVSVSDLNKAQADGFKPVLSFIEQAPEQEFSTTQSGLLGALQGASLGFADELEASIRSNFSDKSYKELQKEIEQRYKRSAEENPKAALAGELVGGFAVPVPGAGLVKGAVSGSKALAGAGKATQNIAGLSASGALIGGAAGLGYSEEDLLSEQIKDAAGSAAAGAVLSPAIGTAIPALINKASDLGTSSRIGRAISDVFSKTKEASAEQMSKITNAKSADEVRAILNEPIFGSAAYYDKKFNQLSEDSEKFVKELIGVDRKSTAVSAPKFKNMLYDEAVLEGKKANVTVNTQEILNILDGVKKGNLNYKQVQDELDMLMKETFNIIGKKRVETINPDIVAKQTKILESKLLGELAKEQEKRVASYKNESIKKAQETLDAMTKDPRAMVNNLADSFVEGQRVRLQTRAINLARQEADEVVSRYNSPESFIDLTSEVAPAIQIDQIRNAAFSRLKAFLPEGEIKVGSKSLVPDFRNSLVKNYNSIIDDTIKSTGKLEQTLDPATGRQVFVQSFNDPFSGNLISKPISIRSELQPYLDASKTIPKKGTPEYTKAAAELSKDILEEMKKVRSDIKAEIQVKELDTGGRLLTAESVDPVTGKTKLLTKQLEPSVGVVEQEIPATETLDAKQIQELKNLISSMYANTETKTTKDTMNKLKAFLSGKQSQSKEYEEAIKKANEFMALQNEELSRPLRASVSGMAEEKITDLADLQADIPMRAAAMKDRLIRSQDRLVSDEAFQMKKFKEGLQKAEEIGMPSAPKFQEDLARMETDAEDVALLRQMYDREELTGSPAALLSRLAMSPIGFALQVSRGAGYAAGRLQGSNLAKGSEAFNRTTAGKLLNASSEELLQMAQSSKSTLARTYLTGLANTEGQKRQLLLFNMIQQPGIRDALRPEGIDLTDLDTKQDNK